MKIGSIGNVNPTTTPAPKIEQQRPSPIANSGANTGARIEAADSHAVAAAKTESDDGYSQKSNEDVLDSAVKQANQTLKMYDRRIDRTVHEVTKAVIYTVRDTKTNEVISEFPSKKIQDMIAKMWELAGLVVDDKA